jgi:hypothetical protein
MQLLDISSGIVKFGPTCPGVIMEQLRQEDPARVQNIRKLETCYSTGFSVWGCQLGCGDPSVMVNFINAIRALEDLQIRNYHQNIDVLWPAIFQHCHSLKRLAIHCLP